MKKILFIIAILAIAQCIVESDLVTGLDQQTGYTLPWYSGYLNISTQTQTMNSHYFFFPSQNKPETDPVILWLNGGPGCSSLLGASQENGPWVFETNSTNIKLNPFSWNNNASVIYIESPPGVGFSTTTQYSWNDSETATANLNSLIQFFNSYEEFRGREFYISGESYAGIYIPTLATDVLEHNKQVKAAQKINLKGILVGNGCTDPLECSLTTLVDPFMYQVFAAQGFLTPAQRQSFEDKCGSFNQPDAQKLNSLACFAVAQTQLTQVDQGVNIYNLIGYCYYQDLEVQQNTSQITWLKQLSEKYDKLLLTNPEFAKFAGVNQEEYIMRRNLKQVSGSVPACVDAIGPTTFFNTLSVKQALHVDTSVTWTMCSNKVTTLYTRSTTGSYNLYPDLISNGLRIWVYSGDVDGAVPTSGTLYWFNKLATQYKLSTVVPWRAWYANGQQEGNRQNSGQFWQNTGMSIVTFKGCGHMVPQDNPSGAFQMLTSYLSGTPVPNY